MTYVTYAMTYVTVCVEIFPFNCTMSYHFISITSTCARGGVAGWGWGRDGVRDGG